jgi:hypothetical protein
MDEDGNEYVGTAVISCNELISVDGPEMVKETPND